MFQANISISCNLHCKSKTVHALDIYKNFNTTLTQSQNFLCEVKLCCRNWTDTRQQPDNDEKCFGNTQNNINTPLKNANTALFFNFD